MKASEFVYYAMFDYDPTTTGHHKQTFVSVLMSNDENSVEYKVDHMIFAKHKANGGKMTFDVKKLNKKVKMKNGYTAELFSIDGVVHAVYRDGSSCIFEE